MKKITILPSPTADTRTCDVSTVSYETLLNSTRMHQCDVNKGIGMFIDMLRERAEIHDITKITHGNMFYEDFKNNFLTNKWWEIHKSKERHHLQVEGMRSEGPQGITLIDVLENIVDGVMAGMARGGKYVYCPIDPALLSLAYCNTISLLLSSVEVEESGVE